MRHIVISLIIGWASWLTLATPAWAQGPDITVITSTLEAEPGFIFTAPAGWLAITDNQGQVVFSRQLLTNAFDFKRQGDNLTYFYSDRFEVLNQEYGPIDTWQADGYITDVHDLQLLDNGHALLLVYKPHTVDLSAYGGFVTATVQSCLIQEIGIDKSAVWEWDGFDHNPISDTNRSLTTPLVDYDHCNAVELDSDGNLLYSSRHLDQITKIDRQTGEVIWKLGGESNEFTFVNDEGFSLQHDIRRLDNGHITLFDNGQSSRGYSRAVEYELDEVAKVITKTWEFHGPFAGCCGSVQRLPAGGTLISWGNGHPTIYEVTPEGEIVFAADMPFNYRSFKFPWQVKYYLPVILK